MPWFTADLKKNGLSNWSGPISIQTLSSFCQMLNRPCDSRASLMTSANGLPPCAACAAAAAAAAAAATPGDAGRAAPGALVAGAGLPLASVSLVAAVAAAAAIAAVSVGLGLSPDGMPAQPDITNGTRAPSASATRERRKCDIRGGSVGRTSGARKGDARDGRLRGRKLSAQ